MPEYIVTIDSEISYELLKDYHFSVKALYDTGNYKSHDLITPNISQLTVEGLDKEDAELVVFNYLKAFNELGIIRHVGHILYITQALIGHEGQYINTEALRNDQALLMLEPLLNLLHIRENKIYRSINIELTSKGFANKDFDDYTLFNEPEVIEKMVHNMVDIQFSHFKSKTHLYSFDINNRLSKMSEPTYEGIKEMVDQAGKISVKVFKADFLYTVCLTLLNYLNNCSHLNPENKALTNDQARIIYATCKIHGLLSVTHEVEVDALNYIRMVLKNKSNIPPMNITITGDLL